MNYLKANLNNSLILPYDIMLLIYEYADFLKDIRVLIERDNKEMLEDIMYERMKKYIIKEINEKGNIEYCIFMCGNIIFVDLDIIHLEKLKPILILYYKMKTNIIMSKMTKICGTFNLDECLMRYHINVKQDVDIALGRIKKRYHIKKERLFKTWLKL